MANSLNSSSKGCTTSLMVELTLELFYSLKLLFACCLGCRAVPKRNLLYLTCRLGALNTALIL
jgi:hypothetical protein